MIDKANEFVAEAKQKAQEETTLSAAEVISLALMAGFVAVSGAYFSLYWRSYRSQTPRPVARLTVVGTTPVADAERRSKNRFQNIAYTLTAGLNGLSAPKLVHTAQQASGTTEDPLLHAGRSPTRSRRHVARYLLLSSRSSAERSSVRAFERITSTASSRESPPMSVSHTNASMPSVAPIP